MQSLVHPEWRDVQAMTLFGPNTGRAVRYRVARRRSPSTFGIYPIDACTAFGVLASVDTKGRYRGLQQLTDQPTGSFGLIRRFQSGGGSLSLLSVGWES